MQGSQTDLIRQLPALSNVNVPGMFVFRVDEAEITNGGCNTAGQKAYSSIACLLKSLCLEFVVKSCYPLLAMLENFQTKYIRRKFSYILQEFYVPECHIIFMEKN